MIRWYAERRQPLKEPLGSMTGVPSDAIAHAVHQIGVLIWIGSLFFVRLVLLPATAATRAPMDRMSFRLAAYRRMFRWGWVSMLLVWGSGLWSLRAPELTKLPLHVEIMAAIAGVMVLLHLVGFLVLYLNMEIAVQEERLIGAAKNNFWMRKLIWVNLILGLAAALLGASGGYLFG
jgi:uncharacterized membrane protein